MQKLALAVVMYVQKLRPSFQFNTISVMTSQPMQTVLHSPSQLGRLAKWTIELNEYDIEYKPRASSKPQVLADLVIELVPANKYLEGHSDKWTLHVNGASSKQCS